MCVRVRVCKWCTCESKTLISEVHVQSITLCTEGGSCPPLQREPCFCSLIQRERHACALYSEREMLQLSPAPLPRQRAKCQCLSRPAGHKRRCVRAYNIHFQRYRWVRLWVWLEAGSCRAEKKQESGSTAPAAARPTCMNERR